MSLGFDLFTAIDLYYFRELKQINQFIFHFRIVGNVRPKPNRITFKHTHTHTLYTCACMWTDNYISRVRALYDISFIHLWLAHRTFVKQQDLLVEIIRNQTVNDVGCTSFSAPDKSNNHFPREKIELKTICKSSHSRTGKKKCKTFIVRFSIVTVASPTNEKKTLRNKNHDFLFI